MPQYATAKSAGEFEVVESHTDEPSLPNHRLTAVEVELGTAAEIAAEIENEIHFRISESPYLLRASSERFAEFFEVPPDDPSQTTLRRRYEGE